jgi:hypothetical protein
MGGAGVIPCDECRSDCQHCFHEWSEGEVYGPGGYSKLRTCCRCGETEETFTTRDPAHGPHVPVPAPLVTTWKPSEKRPPK